jgi:hypothetical protein
MNKNSKIFSKKSALIAGIALFALTVPFFAQARLDDWIVNKAFRFVAKLILSLVGFLTQLATSFFGAMLKIGFDRNSQGVAQIGWEQSRNFANLLFILFMVVVAFATILRLERYGAKQLLPKIIIIALLINFSFVICAVIIDFSNLTANIFINNANNESGPKGVGAQLVENMKLATTLTPSLCADYDLRQSECDELLGDDAAKCKAELEKKKTDCEEAQKIAQQSTSKGDELVNLVMTTIIGAIVLLIATFVLFAAGILLLIRVIAIWFLVILSPIVFILYIMPGLRPYYERWWKSFINWCIFAPIFAFFMWIALKASKSISLLRMTRMQAAIQAGDPSQITGFFADGSAILNYFLVIGLLIGGMIAAKQLGIYGASTALAIGKKWGKGATDWTKRTATRPAKYTATQAGGAITAGIGKAFGRFGFGRRLESKGYQIKMKAVQERQHKAYAALLGTMSNENINKEIRTAGGVRAIIATREAQKRGILREADRDTIRKSAEAMQAYGATESARSLTELRPDALRDTERRKEAIERAVKEGTHKKWSKEVFKGLEGQEIVKELQRQLGASEFGKVFGGWAKDIKDTAGDALKASFTDDFANKDNVDSRELYAKATGKAYDAYSDKNGRLQEALTKSYIRGMKDDGFSDLDSEKDKELAARFMSASQVIGAGNKLSGADKDFFKKTAEQYNKEAFAQMQKTPVWGGSPPTSASSNVIDLSKGKITPEEAWKEVEQRTQKLEEEEKRQKESGSITDKNKSILGE